MTSLARFVWAAGGQRAVEQITEKVVEKVAAEVLAEAARDAPVDTGTLAGSIVATDPTTRMGTSEVQVGTPVEYGPFVEFGTRHMRAQPFLGPALERARQRYG